MDSRSKNFEDLVIYQRSLELALKVYRISRFGPFSQDPSLQNQIQRAAVSVMSNIAEGFERGSNTEFIQFLYISKGSCGEVRAQVTLAHRLEYIGQRSFDDLYGSCRILSGMLANMITSLKDPRYRGNKYRMVFKTRQEEAKEFWEEFQKEQAEKKAQEAQEAQEAQGVQEDQER